MADQKDRSKFIPALGYDFLTGMYDRMISLTMPEKKFRSRFIDQIDLKPNEVTLDFGFGTASQTILAKKKTPSAILVGLDIDPKVKELAEKKIKARDLSIQLDLYDGGRFPYPDRFFDKVFSSLVFHQLDKKQKASALEEILRVLKPGGEVHIADWGKAKNVLMRIAFLVVQVLDGFKTTDDNVRGLLPEFLSKAGFKATEETGYINTMIGSFSFYKAIKTG